MACVGSKIHFVLKEQDFFQNYLKTVKLIVCYEVPTWSHFDINELPCLPPPPSPIFLWHNILLMLLQHAGCCSTHLTPAHQCPGEQQIVGATDSARLCGSHPLRAWARLPSSQKPNLLPSGTSRSQKNRASTPPGLPLFSSQLTIQAHHVLDIWS